MDDVSECSEKSLKLLELVVLEWSLGVSILISIGQVAKCSCLLLCRFEVNRDDVYANPLIGTTIQGSDKRKRSSDHMFLY